MGGDRLGPYLCDLHREWLAREPQTGFRVQDASLLFFDISGFTPLTERLAKRGKAGVEKLIDTLNGVVAPLVETAGALGGDTLKFGGDALLLLFTGDEHERRACAAAFDMQVAMAPFRRMRTDAGIVSLRASAAVASGPIHLFLAGDRFRELIVAGETTTEVMELERDAEAGEVLLGRATCARLEAGCHSARRDDGATLLAARPAVDHDPPPAIELGDPAQGLPTALHDHLGPAAESEHRQVTVGFAQFRGLDELLEREGPQAAAEELEALISRAQRACDDHGVTFLATDTDRAAGKVFAVAGAPTASTDDEDRMLFAMREIVAHAGALRVRAGVNRGRAFAVHLGAPHRRTYTTMGDTTNVAARVMGKAPDGEVLATRAVLDHSRAPFALTPVVPFAVKGKRMPIEAELVGAPRAVAARAAIDSPLAGREAELRALRGALQAARAGEGRIVELVAEPGMGKSRLLAEVMSEPAGDDLRRVVIEAGAYGTSTPYFALRTPLRRLISGDRDESDDEQLAATLARCVREHMPAGEPLLPLIAIPFGLELAATKESARLSSDVGRAQLHLLIDGLLAALLPARQTVLLIEDAHWLDEASSDLLRTVLRRVGERSWATFVTRRPSTGGLEDLPDSRTRIELEPLAPEAARSLVVAGGEGGLAPHITAALVERSHGNPLFLRELIAAARAGAEVDELPATVEALLTARIDTLRPADRRLLRRAAVLGQRFPMSWLSAMLEMPEDELLEALSRLADFLEVEPGRVRFQHALQREAAYEALPFERRRAMHARAGALIEQELGSGAEDAADILALHFLRAQEYERAWSYGRVAAEQARDRYAHADAAQLYRRALEAAHALKLAPQEMSTVYEALGEAYAYAGELQRAHEAFTRARRFIRGDVLREAELLHRHARAAMDGGEIVRAARFLLRGLRTLDGMDPATCSGCRATLLSELAGARLRQGRYAETIELCHEAITYGERSGEEAAVAHACYLLDWALVDDGRPSEAVHSERALEIYRRRGDPDREAAVLNNLGGFAYYEGRWDDAVALYRHGAAASTRAGNVNSAAVADVNIGEVRSDQGRLDEARERLERALEIWRGTGQQHGVAYALALLGRVEARAGRHDEALALLADALARYRELRLSADALWVEALIAEAHALAQHWAEAVDEGERLLDIAGSGRLGPLLHRVRGLGLQQLGRVEEAQLAFETGLAQARDRADELEIVLTLDALIAGGRADPSRRRERDAILERLDIAALSGAATAPRAPVAATRA